MYSLTLHYHHQSAAQLEYHFWDVPAHPGGFSWHSSAFFFALHSPPHSLAGHKRQWGRAGERWPMRRTKNAKRKQTNEITYVLCCEKHARLCYCCALREDIFPSSAFRFNGVARERKQNIGGSLNSESITRVARDGLRLGCCNIFPCNVWPTRIDFQR